MIDATACTAMSSPAEHVVGFAEPDRIRSCLAGVDCVGCAAHAACLPTALPPTQWRRINRTLCKGHRVPQGQVLYRAGERFSAIYAIRSGSFKSLLVHEDGRDQITGVHLRGELVGTEGIATGLHTSDLLALHDSEVCVIPYALLRRLTTESRRAQRWFHGVLGRDIVLRSRMIALLGSLSATARVASFLLGLSQRFAARGGSPREFDLPVTRRDLAAHLSISAETMSRVLTRFTREGLIRVEAQQVELLDPAGLKDLAAGALR